MWKKEYVPTEPYIIKSGNRKDESLEVLMFRDYPFLKWNLHILARTPNAKRDKLHRHLEWLLKQGENIAPTLPCPQCGMSGIRFFLALGSKSEGYTIGPRQTCCERQECRENLESMQRDLSDKIYPIRFSSIVLFQNKTDQQRVYSLLISAFKLQKPITKKKAFRLFLKGSLGSPASQ